MTNRKMQKMLIPSFIIMIGLAIMVATLPYMFGTLDTAADENNISTSGYGNTYETGTTFNLYLIYFLEGCLFVAFIMFVVSLVETLR